MRIEGQRTYATNREVLWSLLNDPLALQRCLPGCQSLEALGPDEYRAEVEIRVGRVVERFSGMLHLEHVVPYTGFSFVAEGQNPDGSMMARGRIALEDAGGGTTLCYEADVDVAGRPATVPPRMLMTTLRSFARRSLDALDKEIATRTRVYTTRVDAPPPAGPAEAVMPVEEARHLLQQRRWLALALAFLTALLLWRSLTRRQSNQIARQVAEILEHAPVNDADVLVETAVREAA
jgi:carbon monoxide dehydrogenase subunit G